MKKNILSSVAARLATATLPGKKSRLSAHNLFKPSDLMTGDIPCIYGSSFTKEIQGGEPQRLDQVGHMRMSGLDHILTAHC